MGIFGKSIIILLLTVLIEVSGANPKPHVRMTTVVAYVIYTVVSHPSGSLGWPWKSSASIDCEMG